MKKWIGLLLVFAVVLALAACGKKPEAPEKQQPELTIDEIQARIDEQFDKIYDILEEHEELWTRLFAESDDTVNETYDDSIISTYLKTLLETHKAQLTIEEQKSLAEDIEKIMLIETELDGLEEIYAEMLEESGISPENPRPETFPAFSGKDLDGNEVDSAALFAGNKVTVVNFWFSSCSPCVDELDELNALNVQLREKGGAVIGINVDTLDGNQAMIDEAKRILEQKGAVYQNIWFASESEAGRFAGAIIGFPTTYVVDGNGRIMGEPLMGGINYPGMMELLQVQINEALGENEVFYTDTAGSTQG